MTKKNKGFTGIEVAIVVTLIGMAVLAFSSSAEGEIKHCYGDGKKYDHMAFKYNNKCPPRPVGIEE